MLAYVLAIAIGLISIIFFLAAFFAPKVHRQDDFLWSGVGLFYALVMWVCAERLTGALLLGQTAATLLLLAYGAETINLRGAIANPEKIPAMKSFSVTAFLLGFSGGLFKIFRKPKVQLETTSPQTQATVKEETTEEIDREAIAEETAPKVVPDSPIATEVDTDKEAATEEETSAIEATQAAEAVETEVTETSEEPEIVTQTSRETELTTVSSNLQTKTVKKESFFSRWFGKKKAKEQGLSAAPILEADEEFEEEKTPQTPAAEITATSETTETVTEVVSEAAPPPAIVDETESETKEVIEKIVIEAKDFKTETPPTDSEAIAEAEVETTPPPETPPTDSEAIAEAEVETTPPPETPLASEPDKTRSESPSTAEIVEATDKSENPEQPQPLETQVDDTSSLKAEIAKIFEEDNKPKDDSVKDSHSNPEN